MSVPIGGIIKYIDIVEKISKKMFEVEIIMMFYKYKVTKANL